MWLISSPQAPQDHCRRPIDKGFRRPGSRKGGTCVPPFRFSLLVMRGGRAMAFHSVLHMGVVADVVFAGVASFGLLVAHAL